MGKKARFYRADELMKNAKPCNIQRDVQRLVEVESLLGTYSVDYVIKTFDYVVKEYGFTEQQLREMAPACVERARYEREREAGIAALMNQLV